MRKGELSVNVIIIAVIGILVLGIIGAILAGRFNWFGRSTSECPLTQKGTSCVYSTDCNTDLGDIQLAYKCSDTTQVCCRKSVG